MPDFGVWLDWLIFGGFQDRGGVEDDTSTPPGVWTARSAGGWAGFSEEGCGGFAEGFEGAEMERRLGGFGGSGGGEVGALTPALSQQTGIGRKTPSVAARHLPHRRGGGGLGEGELVGEVGGFLEGSEGLEVEGGLDGRSPRGVDGLDRFDRGLVVGGLGDFAEL